MSEKQPVAEALRAEILKLASEGDQKSEGALTPDVLLRIMRVAKTGRELLVSLSAKPTNLASMVQRPQSPFAIPYLGQAAAEADGAEDGQSAGPLVYAPSPPTENFAMTAMREIIAAAKNLNGGGASPAKLVEALAIAREKGLDDVARDLEEQLGMQKAKPVAAVVSEAGKNGGSAS